MGSVPEGSHPLSPSTACPALNVSMDAAVRTQANFMHSDPSWRVPLELPDGFLPVDDVRAGDVVYTRRPKGYQRLAAVAGDTWRHVGLCVTIAGFPWLVEMGPVGFQARPMTTIFDSYDTVAVQRLRPCAFGCRAAFVNNVCARMQRPTGFHTRVELAGIGLSSLLRLARPGSPVAERMRHRLLGRSGFASRAICSTPIVEALSALCERHHVVLDTTSDKHESPSIARPTMAALAMPDDIWRALQSAATPFWVRKDEAAPATPVPADSSLWREEVRHMQLGT